MDRAIDGHGAVVGVVGPPGIGKSRLVRELHGQGVAHLPVRIRDGTGLVGPLVIPGVTSCLDSY